MQSIASEINWPRRQSLVIFMSPLWGMGAAAAACSFAPAIVRILQSEPMYRTTHITNVVVVNRDPHRMLFDAFRISSSESSTFIVAHNSLNSAEGFSEQRVRRWNMIDGLLPNRMFMVEDAGLGRGASNIRREWLDSQALRI